jgi:heterokaryon incompatibility protein (HET)
MEVWLSSVDTGHKVYIIDKRQLRRHRSVAQLRIVLQHTTHSENFKYISMGHTLFDFKIQVILEPSLLVVPYLSLTADKTKTQLWRLLKWMDDCENFNSDRLRTDGAPIFDFHGGLHLSSKIIDIRRRRIVQAPKDCRYVALSYVWGGRNSAILDKHNERLWEIDGGIHYERLPKTILDAIRLCMDLNERYLWVDSPCISQDSHRKHDQIKSMESVYRGACMTIVAAAGSHAEHGLPCYREEPLSFKQCRTIVQGLELSNVSPDFEFSVESSVWNTRAWTFQERLLSQRLIIFTKNQIYLQCSHEKTQIDSILNPHHHSYRDSPVFLNEHLLNPYRLELARRVNLNIYARVVEEYTRRKLSVASDVENAFEGISKIVGWLFGGSRMIFGISVAVLQLALLWRPKSSMIRRSEVINDPKTTNWKSFARLNRSGQANMAPKDLPQESLRQKSNNYEDDDPSRIFDLFPINPSLRDQLLRFSINQQPSTENDGGDSEEEPSEQNHVYPSWSWTGWIGEIEYSDFRNASERPILKVEWLDPVNQFQVLSQDDFGPPEADAYMRKSRWLRQLTVDKEIYYQ